MPTTARTDTRHLLGFNQQVLDQALAVVQAHATVGAPAYDAPVGAHVRHLIEHYEALVNGLATGIVDYDGRPRDQTLQTSHTLAAQRLLLLRDRLGLWTPDLLTRSVLVFGQCGPVGDLSFSVVSSVGRELAFLASHTVHHFALMAAHLRRNGLALSDHFGMAPATVANEIAMRRTAAPSHFQESLCSSLSPSA